MRGFFGFEVEAPWPSKWPKGRVVEKQSRHITVAFMPEFDCERIISSLDRAPKMPFDVGFCGELSHLVFLPHHHPNVVAYEPHMSKKMGLFKFQRELSEWLLQEGVSVETRPWLPHMTIARKPFDKEGWESLPFMCRHLHLYESMGNSHYEKRWTKSVLPPFEQMNSNGFRLIGESLEELYHHAKVALAFLNPHFLECETEKRDIKGLEDVIWLLNKRISFTNIKEETGIKSVGGRVESLGTRLMWEMSVDS